MLGRLQPGGVETWLLHIARNIDSDKFEMAFFVTSPGEGEYEEELGNLGCQVIHCCRPHSPTYPLRLGYSLKRHGPFHVVHSHQYLFSGITMFAAWFAGAPARIAHSHNDHSSLNKSVTRKIYRRAMQWLLDRFATHGLACSKEALIDVFGSAQTNEKDYRVLHCSLDFSQYGREPSRREREKLKISDSSLVLGHVGRFVDQKNQQFLIRILRLARRAIPDVSLVMIGDGELRQEIEALAVEQDVRNSVHFLGWRKDVPQLLGSDLFDCFLLPSLHEGLGLVAVEAQASGLPCILSDQVPDEAVVVDKLVRRNNLEQPNNWVADIIELTESKWSFPDREQCRSMVANSTFDVSYGIQALVALYSHSAMRASDGKISPLE